ncbi:hypothetical protein SAMN05443663_103441 [Flavobacterium defluvii]|uniref:Uncharacterized protein n=2 Tax=Flavobacterium defluvii TaxID=370979 RepID=A0A1M5LRD1_9FLAO|nr:hypothetical protein SAMN05443663_103441 [Flavobacterium defluvii]
MKKLIVLFSLILTYSCSSEETDSGMKIDNDYPIPKEYKITPPTWILGTWVDSGTKKIVFTKSDIICDPAGNPLSAKGETLYYIIQEQDPEITQTQTENSYFLQYKISSSERRTFNFIKISETEIESKGTYKGIFTKK